jgi:hypothetical protein
MIDQTRSTSLDANAFAFDPAIQRIDMAKLHAQQAQQLRAGE